MSPLRVGDLAPEVPAAGTADGPRGLFFYKVTCPTCQLAAPVMRRFERAYPGRVIGIGQDPEIELARFTQRYDMGIASIEDVPPYPISAAYDLESVPTLYLVNDGRVQESVGAWERDGFNRVASALAGLVGEPPVIVSMADDGLPEFKPG
jgi:hypothetical protein